MSRESKLAFFRQSGWLVASTIICGLALITVTSIVSTRLAPRPADVATYLSMLRFFTVLGIVTSGLQSVMAQDAAAAVSVEAERQLSAATRSVSRAIFLFWILLSGICLLNQEWLLRTLKIGDLPTLLVTLGLVLAQLFLPFSQGLLQGQQLFGWLGWSIMMNGAGRFVAIYLLLRFFSKNATTALAGVLLGLAGAVLLAAWPSRRLFLGGRGASFSWKPWLQRAVPLIAGSGALLFLMNADVLIVQAHFSRESTLYYSAVAILGIGLVSFTTPMAAVMFPKMVRSVVQSQQSDSLMLAVAGTAVLGVLGALFCTLFPALPLRILFSKTPGILDSARLVPWFMWSMLPMTLATVLVGSLLARRDFRGVPVFVAIAAGYGLELNRYLGAVNQEQIFPAFSGVILRLGLFSLCMAGAAVGFTLLQPRATTR